MAPRASDWLFERMAGFPDRPAIRCGDEQIGYGRLSTRVAEWIKILDELGVRPGAVVAISGTCVAAAAALFLALTFDGYVAAPPPAGSREQRRYLDLASAEALIELGGPEEWSWSRLTPGETPPLVRRLRERHVGGLVVFSSGTTGQSKAALFRFFHIDRALPRTAPAQRDPAVFAPRPSGRHSYDAPHPGAWRNPGNLRRSTARCSLSHDRIAIGSSCYRRLRPSCVCWCFRAHTGATICRRCN